MEEGTGQVDEVYNRKGLVGHAKGIDTSFQMQTSYRIVRNRIIFGLQANHWVMSSGKNWKVMGHVPRTSGILVIGGKFSIFSCIFPPQRSKMTRACEARHKVPRAPLLSVPKGHLRSLLQKPWSCPQNSLCSPAKLYSYIIYNFFFNWLSTESRDWLAWFSPLRLKSFFLLPTLALVHSLTFLRKRRGRNDDLFWETQKDSQGKSFSGLHIKKPIQGIHHINNSKRKTSGISRWMQKRYLAKSKLHGRWKALSSLGREEMFSLWWGRELGRRKGTEGRETSHSDWKEWSKNGFMTDDTIVKESRLCPSKVCHSGIRLISSWRQLRINRCWNKTSWSFPYRTKSRNLRKEVAINPFSRGVLWPRRQKASVKKSLPKQTTLN